MEYANLGRSGLKASRAYLGAMNFGTSNDAPCGEADAKRIMDAFMATLDGFVRAGKVRYIGCSNYTGSQIVEAQWAASRRGGDFRDAPPERVGPGAALRGGSAPDGDWGCWGSGPFKSPGRQNQAKLEKIAANFESTGANTPIANAISSTFE